MGPTDGTKDGNKRNKGKIRPSFKPVALQLIPAILKSCLTCVLVPVEQTHVLSLQGLGL